MPAYVSCFNPCKSRYVTSGYLLFCVLQKVPDSVMSLTFTEIRQISCGAHFMMAMDEDGEIHSWGANKYGQVRLSF